MGPVRTPSEKKQRNGTDQKESQRNRPSKKRKVHGQDSSSTMKTPGVQKLKSALRQTRRLLARDNLAADVRVETERRLKSLESDLEMAERGRKERDMAKRYHKVKFFERRKVQRRIRQVKRELDSAGASSSTEATTQLESTLAELHVQLNYILNFPKLEKYISLFPPSQDADEQNPDLGDAAQPPQTETDARRRDILNDIKERMAAGFLSKAPEMELESGSKSATPALRSFRAQSAVDSKDGRGRAVGTKEVPIRREKREQGTGARTMDDDFFEARTDSESSTSSDSRTSDAEN